MNIAHDIVLAGGTTDDQGQAYGISYWHIPNGADYSRATACMCFINDKEAADRIALSYDSAPEMAIVLTRAQLDEIKIQIANQKR